MSPVDWCKSLRHLNKGVQNVLKTVALFVLIGCGLAVLASYMDWSRNQVPAGDALLTEAEVEKLCGWAGREKADRAWFVEGMKDQFVPFLVADSQGNRVEVGDSDALLWEPAIELLGSHIPTFRQEVGDCVGNGAANAAHYTLAVQVYLDGGFNDLAQEWAQLHPSYIYGISRVQIGGDRIGGDGSLGAWAAKGVMDYGVVSFEQAGKPYSGALSRQWGRRPGPPQELIEIGKKHVVKSAARCMNGDDVATAIQNGYACSVASNRGFAMQQTRRTINGVVRMVATPSGSWAHQMAVIGWIRGDGASPKGYFYILNSWGANAHSPPTDGAPPGGFWVTWMVMDSMCKSGEVFAFSGVHGFPARKLNRGILMNRPEGARAAAKALHECFVAI